MYAIIETGSKQYKVCAGDVIYVEKLNAQEGETVQFDVLMLSDGSGVKAGTPILDGVSVEGEVLGHGKSAKVIVFKYKSKKNYRVKQGHRQPFTKVKIVSVAGHKAVAQEAEAN
ncbi:MAG: 50S ribosomal protein L21 [Christensenellales bacterium]|jgi:large subunit ribosomal protein L21